MNEAGHVWSDADDEGGYGAPVAAVGVAVDASRISCKSWGYSSGALPIGMI